MATAKANKVTNVAEVDAAKRRESDLKAQEEHVTQLIADMEAKKAEYEKQMEEQIKKYMEPDPEMLTKNPVRPVFKPMDFSEIPDVAYDRTTASTIKWRKDSNTQYRLVRYKGSTPKVAGARARGWKPLYFRDSFEGTDHFEPTTEGYVLMGDCIIMQMPKDEYQNRIVAQKKALQASREASVESQFVETAEQMSRVTGQKIDAFRHDGSKGRDSKIEYLN